MWGTNFIPGGSGGKTAGRNIFYHGTDVPTAINFLRGEALDATKAAGNKIDGSAGFFLATNADDAMFFGVRRQRGNIRGTILEYEFTDNALNQLNNCGLICRPIPGGNTTRFAGDELFFPVESFQRFNQLRDAGEIIVRPFSQ